MGDIANQDEARKCLEIASANLQSGHLEKASRFAEKAMKLYPNDEARKIIRLIKSRQGGPSSSGASPSTNGSASAADMRRRTTAASSSGRQDKPEDRSTPQQKELVASILRKKSYYEVLGVEKDSNEDEIKRAYKKLALKLHPDKNTAPRSDEAFKIVSKAFSCLSDAQKRAAYDRYGEEEPGLSRTASRGPFAGQGYDDFDPNEIFNMFFGGGFAGQRNAHVFNFGRGFPGQHQQRAQGQAAEPPSLPHQLLSILPILLMLAFTFFAMRPSEPVFSIDRGGEFLKEMKTARYNVPYFVKASTDFERTYPRGSRDRARVEQEAEVAYKERLDRQCYNERMQQQRMFRWGQPGKANSMPMPSCKEIVDRFGNQYAYQSSMYGF